MAVTPYKSPELEKLIYVKTNIGGWFFDAFISIQHSSSLRITEHPVQTGAAITDHAFMQPKRLSFEIGMSDVASSLVDGQFTEGWSRSVTAYQVLEELQRSRIPMQVMTRLGLYQNMLIESIDTPDDYTKLYGLRCTVNLREIIMAEVKTVKVSARPQVTGSTNKGNVQPVQPNQSILKQIYGMIQGGNQ